MKAQPPSSPRSGQGSPESPSDGNEASGSEQFSKDGFLKRLKSKIEAGGDIGAADVRVLLERYEKLEARLEKIVRISDAYQGQLREATLRMDYMARTDQLTGLANRRDILERLEREYARFGRYGTVFSIVLFDIDNFKRVNDSYGHNAGDSALKSVAGMFGRELRETDLCGRWGGEEFLVICPETAVADAVTVAEKCRAAIASAPIVASEGEIPIRLSGGVCGVEAGLWVDELVKRADDALYHAKALGKDRIVGWPFA